MARKGRIVRHSIRCDKCGRTMYFEAPVGLPDHNNLYRASWYRCHNCGNWSFVELNRYGGVRLVTYGQEATRSALFYGGTQLLVRAIENVFLKRNKKDRRRR
jgi:predicted nucleic-acid-binding Zn-ribbon protein